MLTYDHYFDSEERGKIIADFQKEYPDLIRSETILKTEEGKDVLAVTISNFKNGDPSDKPAFYVDGNTHAGEVTGMMVSMYLIDYLLSNYGKNDEVNYLMDSFTFYVIPCISPDGSDTYLHTPNILRSVNRDYNKEIGGLYKKDMDDDGVIRMMRIKSRSGKFKIKEDNPDLMVPRAADDVNGTFYDVYTEGEIEDYDGVNIKVAKEAWCLDFNRNYPFGWFNDFRQSGAGPYPLSNKETKAVVDFVIAHPNICSVLTNHTSGGVLLTPPGTYSAKKAPEYDVAVYKELGKLCKKTCGYKDSNIFDGFVTDQENYDSGAFDDWCYETKGVFATTLELWNLEERAGMPNVWGKIETLEEECQRMEKCYGWIKENYPEGFKSWEKFNHPQLGEVEIGGFDIKHTFQNPPEKFLEQELVKATNFALKFASLLPNVELVSCKKENIGDNIYKVEAIIENTGYLPTYISDKAKMIKANKGITCKINGEVLEGKNEVEIGELSSYSKTESTAMFYGNIATFNSDPIRKKISFIVRSDEDIVLEISGNKIFNKKIKL